MRKRIIGQDAQDAGASGQAWLDIQRLAQVEITSEDAAHPIEAALTASGAGWRAAQPGEQTIRMLFDEPQRLRHIRLAFQEAQHARTQEFVLRWSADNGASYREIVRQQYGFSPSGATSEVEDYTVDLAGVTALELVIVPDISQGDARASLAALQLR